ncbi:MAG TPA: glycosyltransferase family 2 protein [Candidatus Saccharimonadales bacterium]|nr:glycosyltransferase family 2 protein [Candidatus Saccharimonadales bacterium]
MISAVILTKNEERNIQRCIKSLQWCDEIVIVDDYSTDKTLSKVKECKVFKRKLNGNFAAQRNFGLSKAKGDWILFIDADEIVTKELQKEIATRIKYSERNGFYLKRKDIFLGRELNYGETGNIKLLRLAKRNSGKWKRKVHEYWDINGEMCELPSPIIHYHDTNLSGFITKINYYSEIHAKENIKAGKRSNLLKIIFYPLGKFFVNYFLKLGFLDGTRGFIMATIMSFHSFLSWSRVWMD